MTIQGSYSYPFNALSGVPQGSILGPLLFIIYINDLPNQFTCQTLLFADDLKIFTEINSIDDCSILQDDLNVLDNWCKLWQLRLNPEKCQVFTCTRKKNKISFNYKLNAIYNPYLKILEIF